MRKLRDVVIPDLYPHESEKVMTMIASAFVLMPFVSHLFIGFSKFLSFCRIWKKFEMPGSNGDAIASGMVCDGMCS